ncbi:NADH-quinone oxidoreductase subunit C [Endomicrobium proavitum]|uniref:Ni,Fe-hydrogenase III large subunit n=1 Tax=Endomicrobium proavitum TaxID=1408281 RepID=A0A0G3WHP2_9BACT|nr:NADH-quinone oxidoreductase subunit C [Endomicrobium proavitum]AKL97417.1 Ni,Fe-hydrogenase III large subunit [Endomicrobium proavitum]
MENNLPIVEKIAAKYPDLKDAIRVQREQRIWIKVPYVNFRKFLEFAASQLKQDIFCMLTGLDDKENFSFIYHMADVAGVMLNIETSVPKTNAVIDTITDIYPAAELQEREVVDLFGVKVNGLGAGPRYPLSDNWPDGQYPMRKDWTADKIEKKIYKATPLKEDCNG